MTIIHRVGVSFSNIIWLTQRISGVVTIITVPSTLACALNHIWFKEYSLTASYNLWSSFVMSRALGHSWTRSSVRFFAMFFNWCCRLARSSTVISTDGFGGTNSVSFIELNMSTTPKLVCWEVAALLFYCFTYDFEFLCKFKISNVEILGHFLQIFLPSCIKFSQPISIGVIFKMFDQARCVMLHANFYNVWYLKCSKYIRWDIITT